MPTGRAGSWSCFLLAWLDTCLAGLLQALGQVQFTFLARRIINPIASLIWEA